MMYARIRDGVVEALIELTDEEYQALVANGKAVHLRVWVVDSQPAVTSTQYVLGGPVVITDTEARMTWVVAEKSPEQLDRETNATETAQLRQLISAITADIDAYNANPDVTGTVAQILTKVEARVRDLERQQRRTNRILRYFLRSLA